MDSRRNLGAANVTAIAVSVVGHGLGFAVALNGKPAEYYRTQEAAEAAAVELEVLLHQPEDDETEPKVCPGCYEFGKLIVLEEFYADELIRCGDCGLYFNRVREIG
jgi:hypothetical protein